MPGKRRLDLLLVDRKLAVSRSKAASMIMAAEVYVDGRIVDKPGTSVTESAAIMLKAKPRYVSRGGLKLEAALSGFGDRSQRKTLCGRWGQHGRIYRLPVATWRRTRTCDRRRLWHP